MHGVAAWSEKRLRPTLVARMVYSNRDLLISARILVRRHGLGALRRAEAHVRRMEKVQAFAAAATWKQLTQEIRRLLDQSSASKTAAKEELS
jgi:hypothetical protein